MRDDPRTSFGPVAANYSRSTFHTSVDRLQEVIDLAKPLKGDLALDVATGTGNTALALAPHVRRVVALDLTREMLDVSRRITKERGIENPAWALATTSILPSPHHPSPPHYIRPAPH